MRKLLCMIGIHKWKYIIDKVKKVDFKYYKYKPRDEKLSYLIKINRGCFYCGTIQSTSFNDHYSVITWREE